MVARCRRRKIVILMAQGWISDGFVQINVQCMGLTFDSEIRRFKHMFHVSSRTSALCGKRFPVDPVTNFSYCRFRHPNDPHNSHHYFSAKVETYTFVLKKVRKKNIDFPASLNFLKIEKPVKK